MGAGASAAASPPSFDDIGRWSKEEVGEQEQHQKDRGHPGVRDEDSEVDVESDRGKEEGDRGAVPGDQGPESWH